MSALTISPVWFIAAGNQEGSAVLVWVRPVGGTVSELRLVTAQHLLRPPGQPGGQYAPVVQGWVPGLPYTPANAITLEIDLVLTPPEAQPMVDPQDFAFLKLDRNATGTPPPLLAEADCQVGLGNLTISGFPGGAQTNAVHGGIVTPVTYSAWTYVNFMPTTGAGILNPGMGTPVGGVSGGGVFSNGRYGGVYRGMYTAVGQHTFIPLAVLRQWCLQHGYELVNLSLNDQVTSIEQSLKATTAEKETNPAMKALTEAGRDELSALKDVLNEFLVYKQLHDQLHLIQIQFANIAGAVRVTPMDDAALDRFALAVDAIEPQMPISTKILEGYEDGGATFKRREAAWIKKLDEAVLVGRDATTANSKALDACMQIRTVLRTHLPRINAELVLAAQSMDLDLLGKLFGDISALPGLPAPTADGYKQGKVASLSLRNTLQQQIQVHDLWQAIDVNLWEAERVLPTAPGASAAEFTLQWKWITDTLQTLIVAANATGTTDWTSKLSAQIEEFAKVMAGTSTGTTPMAVSFDRLAQAIRRQFYKVDKDLKEQAERVADLGTGLAPLT